MDGANIVLLLKTMYQKEDMDILTIHDCFGSHANKTEILSYLVKEGFLLIYGNATFIDKFHDDIKNYISKVYTIKNDKFVIDKAGNEIKIPEKPVVRTINLETELRKSSYFIN